MNIITQIRNHIYAYNISKGKEVLKNRRYIESLIRMTKKEYKNNCHLRDWIASGIYLWRKNNKYQVQGSGEQKQKYLEYFTLENHLYEVKEGDIVTMFRNEFYYKQNDYTYCSGYQFRGKGKTYSVGTNRELYDYTGCVYNHLTETNWTSFVKATGEDLWNFWERKQAYEKLDLEESVLREKIEKIRAEKLKI